MHCNFICGLSDVTIKTFSQSVSQSVHYIDLVDVISAHLPTEYSIAVPRTRTTLGDRSFVVSEPRVWNSLPAPGRVTVLIRAGNPVWYNHQYAAILCAMRQRSGK